ncbi:MAG: gfo/Idh/MocA family oxidoreductase [Gemmatimonadetes bacterium]|nr:MAG: gfo/Idh/MocA family oxidoreductase [Gemmatimonadota bacterium]
MPKLKMGVIGTGHLGQHHARVYTELKNAELIGIADASPERAAEIAGRHNVPGYTDYRELIPHCDAVNIAVPTQLHFEVAKAALEAGKHVLIEKPITSTIEQAEELLHLAHQQGVLIQVGHIERFNAAVIAMEGVIGTPLFIESHRLAPFVARGTDVAVVLDLMIHDLDIILSFVKSEPKAVHAAGASILSDSEDIANARIEFENGCIANVTTSRVSRETVRKIRFFQRDAYISLDYHKKSVEVIKLSPMVKQLIGKSKQGYTELAQKAISGGMNINFDMLIERKHLPVKETEPLKLELQSFVDCIQAGRTPVVSGEDGLRALKMAYLILERMQGHSFSA